MVDEWNENGLVGQSTKCSHSYDYFLRFDLPDLCKHNITTDINHIDSGKSGTAKAIPVISLSLDGFINDVINMLFQA